MRLWCEDVKATLALVTTFRRPLTDKGESILGVAVDIEKIVKKAMQSTVQAALKYQEMSGGGTVHEHAIETFISSKIAEALYDAAKDLGGAAALEMTFREVEERSGASRRGRPNGALPPNGRFDVVVGQKDSENGLVPTGLIEVKKRFSPASLEKDLGRLSEAARRYGPMFGGSVKFGLAISLQRIFENGRAQPEKMVENFRNGFNWPIEPIIEYLPPQTGEFNLSSGGRRVVGICPYSVLFIAPE